MINATDRRPPLIALWALLMLIALAAGAARADVTASVDRNSIGTDETLTLTLRNDSGSMFSSQPDLSPLGRDFRVLGTSTSTEQRIVNGSSSASTTWAIQLAPRHAGTLTIPPIEIDGKKTRPITIRAIPPSQAQGQGQAQGQQGQGQVPATARGNVSVEANVSSQSVYQTAQLLLTVRVYYRGALGQGSSLQPPDINDALVERVDRSHYQKVVNGIGYNIIQQTYAVFPSKVGELRIAPFTLRAAVADPASASIFDPFGTTHTIIRRSQPITVEVKPPPSSYHGGDWLPARALTLKQSFSEPPGHVRVGQSITRTITITGRGLMASQLPPLFADKIAGLKVYPDQPHVNDTKSARGVTGSREEAIAVVPTKPGDYRLPEVKVHWWDLKAGRERIATLPAVTLTVLPAAGGGAGTPPSTTGANPQPAQPAMGATPAVTAVRPWPWIAAVAALACAWLATLWWHWRQRRRWSGHAAATAAPPTAAETAEPGAWSALEAACRANDPARAQPALYRWIRLARSQPDVCCMDDLRQLRVEPALLDAAAALDAALSGAGSFDGNALLTAAAAERQRDGKRPANAGPLPGLYDY